MGRRAWWAWVWVWVAWAGCADDGVAVVEDNRPPGRYPLVGFRTMEVASAEVDPFAARRPSEIVCELPAYGWELFEGTDSYFVETWRCNYHAAVGTLASEVRAGDVGIVRLFHFPLDSPPGSVAHLGLAIGGEVVWEKELVIPSDPAFLTERWRAARGWAVGTPVVLQVNNHGNNSYQFQELGLIVGGEE